MSTVLLFLQTFTGFWIEIKTHIQQGKVLESSCMYIVTTSEGNEWDVTAFPHCSCSGKSREQEEVIIIQKLLKKANNYPLKCSLESPQWETQPPGWVCMQKRKNKAADWWAIHHLTSVLPSLTPHLHLQLVGRGRFLKSPSRSLIFLQGGNYSKNISYYFTFLALRSNMYHSFTVDNLFRDIFQVRGAPRSLSWASW